MRRRVRTRTGGRLPIRRGASAPRTALTMVPNLTAGTADQHSASPRVQSAGIAVPWSRRGSGDQPVSSPVKDPPTAHIPGCISLGVFAGDPTALVTGRLTFREHSLDRVVLHDAVMDTFDRLLTTRQLAEYLAVPVATLYGWRHEGAGPPGFRVGKHIRRRWADVGRWIRDRVRDAEASRRLDRLRTRAPSEAARSRATGLPRRTP
jgi:excisionase family DNA binding protein